METGNVNEDKKAADNEHESLKEQVALMLKKIQDLEQNKNVQISGPTGGFSVEQMAQIIRAAKPTPEEEAVYRFEPEYNLGPDDYDSTGVLYTAPSTGIVIIDDKRQGVAMRTPNKTPIFFMFEGQIKSRDPETGKQILNTFSCYLSRSKAEQEWLNGHSLYGVQFSRSGKTALSTDTKRMQKLQAFLLALQNLDNPTLVMRCTQNNIAVSNDVPGMRIALAEKQLDDYEKSTENPSQRMARESEENRVFLEDKTQFTRK